jgi:hypothetical protein
MPPCSRATIYLPVGGVVLRLEFLRLRLLKGNDNRSGGDASMFAVAGFDRPCTPIALEACTRSVRHAGARDPIVRKSHCSDCSLPGWASASRDIVIHGKCYLFHEVIASVAR